MAIKEDICKFYLIRHGLTQHNLERQFQGTRINPGILPQSRELISSRTEAGLVPDDVKTLWVSDLLRAQETASLYFPHMSYELVPGVRERDFGDWDGLVWFTLEDDPDYIEFRQSEWRSTPPNGEDFASFNGRLQAVLDRIAQMMQVEPERFPLAIVCHGGAVMQLTELLFPAGHAFHRYYAYGAGGLELTVSAAGFKVLRAKELFAGSEPLEMTSFYQDHVVSVKE